MFIRVPFIGAFETLELSFRLLCSFFFFFFPTLFDHSGCNSTNTAHIFFTLICLFFFIFSSESMFK